jgi:hypothetical protein
MTPRRYNAIYRMVQTYSGKVARSTGCPVTFVGLQHHEGVWNTPEEIDAREDHPYKYGYGMLCHSGYHYVDVLSGLLGINERLLGPLRVHANARTMSALDQVRQLPHARLVPQQAHTVASPGTRTGTAWGETDIVIIGTVRRMESEDAVSLFSLDLLQTSTSLRTWAQLPRGRYNKNGRYASETLRVNIGTLAAIEARILKVPLSTAAGVPLAFTKEAEITVWRNGSPCAAAPFRRKRYGTTQVVHGNADLGAGRARLFEDWINGRPTRSDLASHTRSSLLFEQFLSLLKPHYAASEACFS